MAEGTVTQPTEINPYEEDMEVVEPTNDPKRPREEESDEVENGDASKKQKVDKSVEEERFEKVEGEGEEEEEEVEVEKKEEADRVGLGPKRFGSSLEMFDYFYGFLHSWPPNISINKYEHLVLLDLLKKGHAEPEKKIGVGVKAFQVRYHPMFKSRCFFLVRDDDTVDDFSFRKCVDHILPLPENMKVKPDANKSLAGSGKGHGGKGGGGGRGHGHGHGHGRVRGGKYRR